MEERKRKEEVEKLAAEKEVEDAKKREEWLEQRALEHLEVERDAMVAEELSQIELNNRSREIQYMQHEDILSFINRQYEAQLIEEREERTKELRKLHEPFQPFSFKIERTDSMYSDSLSQAEILAEIEEEGGSVGFRMGSSVAASSSLGDPGSLFQQLSVSENNPASFKFTPNVTQQIQRLAIGTATLDDQNTDSTIKAAIDTRDISPVKIKNPILGWAGLDKKKEALLKREADSRSHSHQVRASMLDRDKKSLRKYQITEIEPIRISSANSTRLEAGLSTAAIRTLDGLGLSSQNEEDAAEAQFLRPVRASPDKSLSLLRSLSRVSGNSSSTLGALHDLSSEVYESGDLESQEVLINKNAHTLASLSSMGHKPGKREHNVAQAVGAMTLNRHQIREIFTSERLIQSDALKDYYDITLQSDITGVKHRARSYLEETHERPLFVKALETYATDNPLLAFELGSREGSVNIDHDDNDGSKYNYNNETLSPGILQSPSLHDYDLGNITEEVLPLSKEELFLSPSGGIGKKVKSSGGKGLGGMREEGDKGARKKSSNTVVSNSRNKLTLQDDSMAESVTSTGEAYRPPFYHQSMAFFGQKIDIREHDPRLAKTKPSRALSTASHISESVHDKSIGSRGFTIITPALAPITSTSKHSSSLESVIMGDQLAVTGSPQRGRVESFGMNSSMSEGLTMKDDVSIHSGDEVSLNSNDSPKDTYNYRVLGEKSKRKKSSKNRNGSDGRGLQSNTNTSRYNTGRNSTVGSGSATYLPPIPIVSISAGRHIRSNSAGQQQ